VSDTIRVEYVASMNQFAKNMEYINQRLQPRVQSRALNRTIVTARGQVARLLRDRAALSYTYQKKRKIIGTPGDPAVKLRNVMPRVHTRKSSWTRLVATLVGYTTEMSAINLGDSKKVPKGGFGVATLVSRNKKKTRSNLYGIKVGSKFIPGAFVQKVDRNKTVHVMMRLQPKTWKKGYTGWDYWRPGAKDRNKFREPSTVLKYTFMVDEADVRARVDEVFKDRYATEYDQAFAYYAGRELARPTRGI
jgi:hypothetical protein